MADGDDGWLPLSIEAPSRRFWRAVWIVFPVFGYGFLVWQFGSLIGDVFQVTGAALVGLIILGTIAPIVLGAWGWVLLNPVPHVDFDRGLLRIRGRTMRLDEVDMARRLLTETNGYGDPLFGDGLLGVRLGSRQGRQVSIQMWSGGEGTLERELRHRLAEVIRRSGIRYPESSYDPTGRFSQYNFPEYFDKEGALAFVLHDTDPPDPPVAVE